MTNGNPVISSVVFLRHISMQIGMPQKNSEIVVMIADTDSTLRTDTGSSIILNLEVSKAHQVPGSSTTKPAIPILTPSTCRYHCICPVLQIQLRACPITLTLDSISTQN